MAQATAFIAPSIPARATAFVAPSLARATAFVAPALPAVPTDVSVEFAPDCGYAQLLIARDLSGLSPLLAVVRNLSGEVVPSSIVQVSLDTTIIRFTPSADGVYVLTVGTTGTTELVFPALVYCRALQCFRLLNKDVATGGNNGQGTVPGDKWRNVNARIRLAIACHAVGMYNDAQRCLNSLTDYCSDCGCGC